MADLFAAVWNDSESTRSHRHSTVDRRDLYGLKTSIDCDCATYRSAPCSRRRGYLSIKDCHQCDATTSPIPRDVNPRGASARSGLCRWPPPTYPHKLGSLTFQAARNVKTAETSHQPRTPVLKESSHERKHDTHHDARGLSTRHGRRIPLLQLRCDRNTGYKRDWVIVSNGAHYDCKHPGICPDEDRLGYVIQAVA